VPSALTRSQGWRRLARFAREKPCWARAGGRLHGVVRSFARRGRSLRRCASSRRRTNQAPSGRGPDPRLFRDGRRIRGRPARSAAGARGFQGDARTGRVKAELPLLRSRTVAANCIGLGDAIDRFGSKRVLSIGGSLPVFQNLMAVSGPFRPVLVHGQQ